jgi:hypothetical protein
MVRPERFELPTYCSGGNRSIQLSYGRTEWLLRCSLYQRHFHADRSHDWSPIRTAAALRVALLSKGHGFSRAVIHRSVNLRARKPAAAGD